MDSVPPQIYDSDLESSMFEFDNGKMKMIMDLDMNGNSVINTSFPFLMTAKYDKMFPSTVRFSMLWLHQHYLMMVV